MMLDLGSPVNTLYHSSLLESYALWSLTHAPTVEAWLDRRFILSPTAGPFDPALPRRLIENYLAFIDAATEGGGGGGGVGGRA